MASLSTIPSKYRYYSALLAACSTLSVQAAPLSLDEYLSQVDGKNQTIASSRAGSEGAGLTTAEADLTYSPNFFFEANWLDDHFRNALFPTAYEKLQNDTYTAGIRQKTPWGLSGTFSYDLNKIGYINGIADSTTVPPTFGDRKFYEGTPKIELSLSLWRNFFGGETKAQEEATRSGALANQFSQSYQIKATRAQGESAYVRLVATRQLVSVYTNSVQNANELLKFNTRQVRLNLAESVDFLQSQANFEAQSLLLQATKDDERVASREFNRLRNIDSDTVDEQLTLPSIDGVKVPERAKLRDDVRAAQESAKASEAQAKIGAERNKPNLEVYGSYAFNARDASLGTTFDQSWRNGQQTTLVGVRFSVPLAFGYSIDAVRGYNLQSDAASLLAGQKLFDQEVEWNDLVRQLSEAKRRYDISESLTKVQKKKLDNERLRLKQGRTTTYQTLTFNQDYNQSEIARIQAQSAVLNILARMKTFGDNSGEKQ